VNNHVDCICNPGQAGDHGEPLEDQLPRTGDFGRAVQRGAQLGFLACWQRFSARAEQRLLGVISIRMVGRGHAPNCEGEQEEGEQDDGVGILQHVERSGGVQARHARSWWLQIACPAARLWGKRR
jgi:hypothetical protein